MMRTFPTLLVALLLVGAAWAGKEGDKMLQQALMQESASDIDAAIAKGADINKKGGGGQTPLMAAVLQGKTKNVVALLKHNPDVTIGEKDGYTPFHGVGFQGRADLVPILVAHGMDPLDMHQDGYIGMHRACWGAEKRHTDTVEAFLKAGVPHDFKDKSGTLPINMVRNNPGTKKLLKEWAKKTKDEM